MADAADLNSAARKGVRVRISAPAPSRVAYRYRTAEGRWRAALIVNYLAEIVPALVEALTSGRPQDVAVGWQGLVGPQV
jgi:hypothetical protein